MKRPSLAQVELGGSWLVLIAVAAAYLVIRLPLVETFVAYVGQSPLYWLAYQAGESWIAHDWPTGTRNLGKSLPMHVYRLAAAAGMDPIGVMQAYIVVEVLVGLAAFYWAARRITPGSGPAVAAAIAITAVLSAVGFANLARFSHPFQWGLYYALAEAFRLVGVVAIGLGRWRLGWAALAAGVVVHPTVGGYGLLAALIVIAWQQRGALLSPKVITPAVLSGVLAGAWLAISMSGVAVTSGQIAPADWFAYTRLFNSHWYPVHVGVFGEMAYRHAMPFLAVVLLGLCGLRCLSIDPPLRRYLYGVVMVSLLLTGVGVVVSEWNWLPMLAKLSLHRASELTLGICLISGLALLWRDFRHGPLPLQVLSVALLLSPFFAAREAVFPLLLVLLRIVPLDRKHAWSGLPVWLLWLSGVMVTIVLWHGVPNLVWQHRALTGWDFWVHLANSQTIVAAALLLAILIPARWRLISTFVVLVGTGAFAVGAEQVRHASIQTQQAASWVDLLREVRAGTPQDALIMPDPSLALGFRDVAQRASFGTMREWLMAAWQYDSNVALFQEGLRRFSIFGIDSAPYLAAPNTVWRSAQALTRELEHRFYGADETFFRHIRAQWGVGYIVRRRSPNARELDFPVIYANTHYELLQVAAEVLDP